MDVLTKVAARVAARPATDVTWAGAAARQEAVVTSVQDAVLEPLGGRKRTTLVGMRS